MQLRNWLLIEKNFVPNVTEEEDKVNPKDVPLVEDPVLLVSRFFAVRNVYRSGVEGAVKRCKPSC